MPVNSRNSSGERRVSYWGGGAVEYKVLLANVFFPPPLMLVGSTAALTTLEAKAEACEQRRCRQNAEREAVKKKKDETISEVGTGQAVNGMKPHQCPCAPAMASKEDHLT